ncbi:MAG: GAF domain-containing protein, partial [Methylococcales bacterium]|nr:GAF domain-containing protein [Methylococcales bacterium]
QQESLRAIIESISNELELRPLLTQIVKHACTLLDADRGSIGLVDAAQNLIRTEAIYQMPPDELGAEMPAGVGLAGRVLETGKVEILNHYADVDYPLLPELAEDAVLGLPIFWHEEMIGFFGIGAESPRRFNDYDIKLLASLARHAAVAIKNARLFERTNQALSETQLLYQTSQRISLAMTVEEVIEAYLEQVARQSRYVCSIATYAYDEAGKRVGIIMRGQWSSEKGMLLMSERLPYMRGGLDPFLDQGDTIIFSDVRSDPRASDILRSIQEKDGRPALVLIPLIIQNRRIGLVALSYTQPYQWPESELWKYQVTAVQLATAIYIRRQHLLLAESEREIAVLQERQILARELHDSVTQLIFSMTLIAQTIAPAWQREPAQGQKRVDRLLDLSRSALSEMRALLFELRSTDETPLPAHTEIRLSGLARLQ